MNLRIHIEGTDPEVRQQSRTVATDELRSAKFQQFCDDLVAAMEKAEGMGIAAPQVGRCVRVFVVNGEYLDEPSAHMVCINPRLTSFSKKTSVLDQGCLSVPGVYGPVRRPAKVRMKAIGRDGKRIDMMAKGILAQILQHEYDHLEGVLFIDKADGLSGERHHEHDDVS